MKLISQVRRKVQKGLSAEEIAEVLEEPVDVILSVFQTIEANPQSPDEEICTSVSTKAAETPSHKGAR